MAIIYEGGENIDFSECTIPTSDEPVTEILVTPQVDFFETPLGKRVLALLRDQLIEQGVITEGPGDQQGLVTTGELAERFDKEQ